MQPENVVVGNDGFARLCDFGLAINTSLEVPVSRVGTLEFMAPEIVRLSLLRSSRDLEALRLRSASLPARCLSPVPRLGA